MSNGAGSSELSAPLPAHAHGPPRLSPQRITDSRQPGTHTFRSHNIVHMIGTASVTGA